MGYLIYYVHQWGIRIAIVGMCKSKGKPLYYFYWFILLLTLSFTEWLDNLFFGESID